MVLIVLIYPRSSTADSMSDFLLRPQSIIIEVCINIYTLLLIYFQIHYYRNLDKLTSLTASSFFNIYSNFEGDNLGGGIGCSSVSESESLLSIASGMEADGCDSIDL